MRPGGGGGLLLVDELEELAAAGLAEGDGQVVLQAVRMPDDAVLAVGRDVPFSPVDLQVIGSAVGSACSSGQTSIESRSP